MIGSSYSEMDNSGCEIHRINPHFIACLISSYFLDLEILINLAEAC
jgi:hypothetical protein